ncbi:methyltransferase domain-containing protein [Macrococcus carouselicus]|uniref:Methyltransferase domain-containing protein n=1 Tax=Macrococcus carouselicus TaxID=69969 RepID=A0A9Q8CKN6_9STAP|nr:methyltransferase domain-containing protein [Macrococcus carouselicus]TDM00813.1 methyltransferase domain-containing protein [Macrococcus carouselicus]
MQGSIEDLEPLNFKHHEFDVLMSSFAFHYLPDSEGIGEEVKEILTISGTFIFSIEHPVYTAYGSQDWI